MSDIKILSAGFMFLTLVFAVILITDFHLELSSITGFAILSSDSAHISSAVAEALEDNQSVRVIIKLKPDAKAERVAGSRAIAEQVKIGALSFDKEELKQKRTFRSMNGFSADITETGLEKLRNNPDIESVVIDEPVSVLLTDTIPLINADDAWQSQVAGVNITGQHQSICIIDTGVDYTHESFGGCIENANINDAGCSKVPSGYDFYNEDNNPMDDHSHGTHVAGIAAANGSVSGVAPHAQIIALKVLSSSGGGFSSDVIAAIEWCTYNATKFNITTISMSLGGSTLYSSNCDSLEPSYAAAANAAAAQNMSVLAASGNNGNSGSIAAPACVFNVTSVGWTSKSDDVSSSSNAGSILDLLAPGSSIVSTAISSGTSVKSGTSMATPHAAGAAALLRQYYQLITSKPALSSDIDHALRVSGVLVTDTRTGNVYPRVDVIAALHYINASPLIAFVSPTLANGSSARSTTVVVNINTDKDLLFATLEFDGVNYTMAQLNLTSFYHTLTSVADGFYTYIVYANATTGRRNVTSRSILIDTIAPNVTIASPNSSDFTSLTVPLNFFVRDSSLVDSCILTNSTGSNLTVSSCANTTFNAVRGTQTIMLYVNDSAGNLNLTAVSFTANLPPVVTLYRPEHATYGVNTSLPLNFTIQDEDATSRVWYSIDHGVNTTITSNTTFSTSHGNHVLQLYANDSLNQLGNTSVVFSVDAAGPNITFVSPTPLNQTYNTTNIVVVNITLDENASSALLEFNGANETMGGSGTNWHATKDASDGNYTFRVYANDTFGHLSVSAARFVRLFTAIDRSEVVYLMNATFGTDKALRLLRAGAVADSSNVSLAQNYTLEFNLSGAFIQVADFSWNGANTSGIVNVTTIVANDSVFGNVTAIGGTLNATYWVEMNSFVSSFVPIVVFDKVYRVFYYMNGTTNSPVLTRVASVCAAGFTNRPCYLTNSGNSSVYLMSFSGASAGSDVEAPQVTIVSPAAGASLSSTSVSLAYVARDNAAVESCFYSLNSGSNTTISNCANTTITAAEGSNTLILYVNDTSGQLNSSSVAFTVTVSSGGSGGSGGGGGGGGGGGSSSGGKKRVVAASVPIISEESAPAAGGVSTSATPAIEQKCDATFESQLLDIHLITEQSAHVTLKYTGDCSVESLTFTSTPAEDILITGNEKIVSGDALDLDIVRIGGVHKRLPAVVSSITGGVIGLTDLTAKAVQRFDAMKTVDGTLTIQGTVEDEVVTQEVPLTVTLFAVEKAVKPLALGGFGALVLSCAAIYAFVYVRRRIGQPQMIADRVLESQPMKRVKTRRRKII